MPAYTPHVPSRTIDLLDDERLRWRRAIAADKRDAARLLREGLQDLAAIPHPAIRAIGWIFRQLYALHGGRYAGEIQAWADALGISPGEATMLNCTYEWSHLWEQLYGCTAGVRWAEGLGLVHVRSMDWPLTNIGRATRLHRFVDGDREFVSVGIAGYVGVLSGMVPGEYSVTINWAPPAGRPRFNWGPSFLLREVLQTCDSYNEAVESLTEARLSTPVFFMVCGVARGQACVIERTRAEAVIRPMRGATLVQANHHVAPAFRANNAAFDDKGDSVARATALQRSLGALSGARTLDDVAACLDVEPVCNEASFQQMAFCPATGEVRAWRWV